MKKIAGSMERGAWSSEKNGLPQTAYGRGNKAGFSLVEVTVAIGIFAFVAVGVLGLLPAALKQRADSSREMRAVMIAEELFSCLKASPSITNVILRDGPGLSWGNNVSLNLAAGSNVVIGYPAQTSVPWFLWGSSRGVGNPDDAWFKGQLHPGAVGNGVDTLARMTATVVPGLPGLYQISVEVRSPANVPLVNSNVSPPRTNTPPVVFRTLYYSL